jgi:DNA-binding transcriptional MerR regulator
MDVQNILKDILDNLDRMDHIRPEDVPGIDLYMDQVTTFMDRQLQASKRYEDDKILTKTMINNYAKNNLLPPPEKKKYSKEHLLLLIFIYYFKNILSISDIHSLFAPLTEKYFHTGHAIQLEQIYDEVFSLEKAQIETLKEDLRSKYQIAGETFKDASSEDKDFLELFSFICMLSLDVYMKKHVIEKLIDQLPEPEKKGKKKGAESQ